MHDYYIQPGDLIKPFSFSPNSAYDPITIWSDAFKCCTIDPSSPPIMYLGMERAGKLKYIHRFLHDGKIYTHRADGVFWDINDWFEAVGPRKGT